MFTKTSGECASKGVLHSDSLKIKTIISLMPFSFHHSPSIKLTQVELFVFLFLCCTELETEDFLENLHILSCFVQLISVLLISCVFWIIKL